MKKSFLALSLAVALTPTLAAAWTCNTYLARLPAKCCNGVWVETYCSRVGEARFPGDAGRFEYHKPRKPKTGECPFVRHQYGAANLGPSYVRPLQHDPDFTRAKMIKAAVDNYWKCCPNWEASCPRLLVIEPDVNAGVAGGYMGLP